ncbi:MULTISPECIES: DUF2968 domain-containing protein [unclassified Caballeronia]|uniref:DUF2968 domain-containing protein n=1 Tax=unclassified Caballeronia TaxID=2646786 RepID=UPI00285C1328|nr:MULTISPECIES: DUF2968 domain-containing protein [unclassified Caballeronia]MDR5738692.1 DUF2968 domain-containing protein [Caballeronia sp. LZ016]MDR5811439.1 DUF2968 domain-containing protein [Caballeronia sp. LZ019]
MKSLLSRRGTLLENAPSFLRQKNNAPVRFTAPPKPDDEAGPDDLLPKSAPPTPSTRVTPLRPLGAASQPGPQALQAAQIAEVEWLMQQSALATFRTFRSFVYSVSLLFYPRDLTYYAVLLHDDAVWRVLKAGDIGAAEPAFRHFVEQAIRLAEADMRRVHLQAQNDQFARLIAESEAQVERVRVDLQRGSSQDQEVALRQQEARKELAQLEARRAAAQAQLNKLQRQMHQLTAASNENVPFVPSGR